MTRKLIVDDARRNASGRTLARNALLVNLLVCPGVGSLIAGRIGVGLLQLAMAGTGFTLVMVWFVNLMTRYYGLMFGDGRDSATVSGGFWIAGAALFALAWLWALATGLSLVREASRVAMRGHLSPESEQSVADGVKNDRWQR